MPPGTEEVLAGLDPLTLFVQIVAALAVLGVFVKALSWLAPLARSVVTALEKAHQVLDDVLGEPEQRDAAGFVVKKARPGVISRLGTIEYHIKANGGESAYDQHTKKLDANTERLDLLARSVEEARVAADRDRATDLEADRELRRELAELAAGFGSFQRQYRRDLKTNHPDYDPGQFGDRFTD